jgi:3-polyprenyl-4-hydroxybenzoate decarboxylase
MVLINSTLRNHGLMSGVTITPTLHNFYVEYVSIIDIVDDIVVDQVAVPLESSLDEQIWGPVAEQHS